MLSGAQPIIPPNLYSVNNNLYYVNEHNSLGSPGKLS